MKTLDIVLLVLAAASLAAGAFGVAAPRINLIALGLLLWVLVPLTTLIFY